MKPQFCWRWLRFLFWNTYRIPMNSRNWMLLKYIYTYYIVSLPNPRCGLSILINFWTIFDIPRHLLVQPPRWKRKTSSIVFTQRQGIVVASRLRSFYWISSAMLGDFSGESSQPHLLFWESSPFFWEDVYMYWYLFIYIYVCSYLYLHTYEISQTFTYIMHFERGRALTKLAECFSAFYLSYLKP